MPADPPKRGRGRGGRPRGSGRARRSNTETRVIKRSDLDYHQNTNSSYDDGDADVTDDQIFDFMRKAQSFSMEGEQDAHSQDD